jgi:transposase-like protein
VLRGKGESLGLPPPDVVGSNPTPRDVTTSIDALGKKLNCPECGCQDLERNGHRYLRDGVDVQRWNCKACGTRFSERRALQKTSKRSLNTASAIAGIRQLGASRREKAKNCMRWENFQPARERQSVKK